MIIPNVVGAVVAVIGLAILLLIPGALLAYQGFIFLRTGVWDWLSVTDVLSLVGFQSADLVAMISDIGWLGVRRIAEWVFLEWWAGIDALIVGAILVLWGVFEAD